MMTEMRKDWKSGKILDEVFLPDPMSYLRSMSVPGTYADHLFIAYLASFLKHDFVIIHLNPMTCENKKYNWIYGKLLVC